MALFGKKKSAPEPAAAESGDGGQEFKRDIRKAAKFFEHAVEVADKRNFDYAIELFTNGLRFDPDNMDKHEALLDVAKRRKVAEGKPPGLRDKLKSSGSDPVSKMLDAERIWAMDFIDLSAMIDFMKRAVEADRAYDDVNLGEVAYWIGSMALEFAGSGKPKAKTYIQIRDLFADIGSYDKAIEACRRAIRLDPKNHQLVHDLKNLDAENYATKNTAAGKAQATGEEEGDFRDNVRDAEFAETSSTGSSGTVSVVDQKINQAKAAYEENPEDVDLIQKLVDALARKEEFESESMAIDLLEQAHRVSGQYKFKVRAGDLKMKMYNREARQLKQFVDAAPEAEEYQQRYEEVLKKRADFELAEYAERSKNYPTDLRLKYEVGKRKLQNGDVDDAIGLLQQGKNDPKVRSHANLLLGRAFIEKGWNDEAIDTLQQGIEDHKLPDDAIGKELRYELLNVLLDVADKKKDADRAEQANKLASEILQLDINYKDIKDRKQKAKDLSDELSSEG